MATDSPEPVGNPIAMNTLQIAALLIVFAGAFGAINYLFFKLPPAIGILVGDVRGPPGGAAVRTGKLDLPPASVHCPVAMFRSLNESSKMEQPDSLIRRFASRVTDGTALS